MRVRARRDLLPAADRFLQAWEITRTHHGPSAACRQIGQQDVIGHRGQPFRHQGVHLYLPARRKALPVQLGPCLPGVSAGRETPGIEAIAVPRPAERVRVLTAFLILEQDRGLRGVHRLEAHVVQFRRELDRIGLGLSRS